MAAPGQHVELEPRRVGKLHEKDPVAGNARDAGRIVAERQGVEAVENQAEMRMLGQLDDAPGMAVGVDARTPCQRFVPDRDPAPGGTLGQCMELRGGAGVVVDRLRRRVRAHQHHARPQLLHDVELAFGAVEVAAELVVAHALEIAEGLV